MLLLRVTYRVRAHQMAEYEKTFNTRVLPLVETHALNFRGIFKTVVGNVGEYMELWEFQSMAEYERQWLKLISDPRLVEIFQTTGPMVENEQWHLLESALSEQKDPRGVYSV